MALCRKKSANSVNLLCMNSHEHKSSMADQLKVRVNPEFDHEIDPEQNEFAYWNPVSAVNDLVRLANAALDITQSITDDMQERMRLQQTLRELNRQLDTVENHVLVEDPLTPTEAKTLKTVSAALERRFVSQGYSEEVAKVKAERDKVADKIAKLDDRIDAGHVWNKTNERVSDNIKTALAFYKDERRRAYQY